MSQNSPGTNSPNTNVTCHKTRPNKTHLKRKVRTMTQPDTHTPEVTAHSTLMNYFKDWKIPDMLLTD